MNQATLGSPTDQAGLDDTEPGSARSPQMQAIRRSVAASLFPGGDEAGTLGRFKLLEHLGSGAMGSVHAAWDPELERRVAIKLLTWSGASASRMKREAKALARLSHPNVIGVHEVGSFEGQVFVAMEFVKGRTLGRVIDEDDLDWRQTVTLYLQAAAGLAAAHEAGLVHRDFKPDNVMVGDDGRVRVLDFGLARPVGPAGDLGTEVAGVPVLDMTIDELTRTGAVVGTPAYMPPEQIGGATPDARADQFAWCVSLYEGLAGERPWRADTLGELSQRIRSDAADMERISGAPAGLKRVLSRGMAADPERRWPDMRALMDAMHVAMRPSRRGRNLALGALALLGSLGGAVVLGVYTGMTVLNSEPCPGPEELLTGVWDDAARTRVGGLGLDPAIRVQFETQLDRWVEQWSPVRTQACDAGSQTARACTEALLIEAQGLVDALDAESSHHPAGEEHWPLPDPRQCAADGEGLELAAVPADAAPSVAKLRLAVERDLFREAGVVFVRAAHEPDRIAEATELGYGPLVAEAKLSAAAVHFYATEYAAAEDDATAALDSALESEHAWIEAKARLLLAEIAASAERGERAEAVLIEEARRAVARVPESYGIRRARLLRDLAYVAAHGPSGRFDELATQSYVAAIDGTADDPDRRAGLIAELAEHLEKSGKHEAAVQRRAEVVAVNRVRLAEAQEDWDRYKARSDLAYALGEQRDWEAAVAEARRVIEDPFTQENPDAIMPHQLWIADWLFELDRLDEAERVYVAAEGAVGEQADLASLARQASRAGRAGIALARGDLAAAQRLLEQAGEGEEAPFTDLYLAWVLLARRDFDGAAARAQRVFEAERAQLDEADGALVASKTVWAACLVATGRADRAVGLLDDAVALEGDPSGQAPRVLALALRALGRDATRAAELEASARAAEAKDRARPRIRRSEVVDLDTVGKAIRAVEGVVLVEVEAG